MHYLPMPFKKEKLCEIKPSSITSLQFAMEARNDSVAERLPSDFVKENWVTSNQPKWHESCRSIYTMRKSCLSAEKKHLSDKDTPTEQGPRTSTSDILEKSLRSKTSRFDTKSTCIICNKIWKGGKQPTTKITNLHQSTLIDKAKHLDRQDTLLCLQGAGYDMVANGICYHVKCMNAFKATRSQPSSKTKESIHDLAFQELCSQIETPLLCKSQAFHIKELRDRYDSLLVDKGVQLTSNTKCSKIKKQNPIQIW